MENLLITLIILICAVLLGRRIWKSLQPGAKPGCGCSCSCCETDRSSGSCTPTSSNDQTVN